MMLFSDAASHGLVLKGLMSGNTDKYPTRHPRGRGVSINPSHAVASLVKNKERYWSHPLFLQSCLATADTEAQFIA